MDQLANVIANPCSLRARENLRDFWLGLGHPQGKFLQAELAWQGHGEYSANERERFGGIAARLISKHAREWAGPIESWARSVHERDYRLGLYSSCTISGEMLVKHGAELFSLAPIIEIGLVEPICIEAVVQMPQLKQLKSLVIESGREFTDRAAMLVANCPYLEGLVEGSAGGKNLSHAAIRALQNSPYLRNLIAFNVTLPDGYQPSPGPLSFVQHEGRWWLQNSELAAPYWQAAADAASLACSSQTYTEEYKVHWPPNLDELIWTE